MAPELGWTPSRVDEEADRFAAEAAAEGLVGS
jgi:hypothetical protein